MDTKVKLYDVGESTPFSQTIPKKKDNEYWSTDKLRSVWQKVKIIHPSTPSKSKIDTLFGRVKLPQYDGAEIRVKGSFYPVNIPYPTYSFSEGEITLNSSPKGFTGYLYIPLSRREKKEVELEKTGYLVDYYLSEEKFIRGWYRLKEFKSFGLILSLRNSRVLGSQRINVGWSDRINCRNS